MLLTVGMTKEKFSDFLGELSQLLFDETKLCAIIYDFGSSASSKPSRILALRSPKIFSFFEYQGKFDSGPKKCNKKELDGTYIADEYS